MIEKFQWNTTMKIMTLYNQNDVEDLIEDNKILQNGGEIMIQKLKKSL